MVDIHKANLVISKSSSSQRHLQGNPHSTEVLVGTAYDNAIVGKIGKLPIRSKKKTRILDEEENIDD